MAKEGRVISPIGVIRSAFKEKFGIPRQSGRVESLTATVELYPPYSDPAAFRELAGFSHLWLIFDFSLAHTDRFSPTVRPPRLGGNRRIGVFASRSPYRPNSLGLSCVRLLRILEGEEGVSLEVGGADLLDGTPIYDIKPYLPFADAHPEASGGYADTVRDHALSVTVATEEWEILPEKLKTPIHDCLADDPRPSYQSDPDRLYYMTFGSYEIAFRVKEEALAVVGVRRI